MREKILTIFIGSMLTGFGTFVYIWFFFSRVRANLIRQIAFLIWVLVFHVLMISWISKKTFGYFSGISERSFVIVAWYAPSAILEIVLGLYLRRRELEQK